MAEKEHEFPGTVSGGGVPKKDCYGVPSGVVHNDVDVLVALGRFQERPCDGHACPLKAP